MIIYLSKFGTTLVSRPSGKEAWLAFQPSLQNLAQDGEITLDFKDVIVLTPSWADEFLTPLLQRFHNVSLVNTENPTVKETLAILDKSSLKSS